MENKYIVHTNRYPECNVVFDDYGKALMAAMNSPYATTISNAATGAILYVTYKQGDIRVFITTVDGEVRIKETK